jgi:hypothetical protein
MEAQHMFEPIVTLIACLAFIAALLFAMDRAMAGLER